MISNFKKLFARGPSDIERAVETIAEFAAMPPTQAMQAVRTWLSQEIDENDKLKDTLSLLRALESSFEAIIDAAIAAILNARGNQTRVVVLQQSMAPFCADVRAAYTHALEREVVELGSKLGSIPLVQSSVSSWLYWVGRDQIARFLLDPKNDQFPWHEIRPTTEYALNLSGGLAGMLSRSDGEDIRLQKRLAYLVLLSRTLSPDLHGRQLLVADRLAQALAAFLQISEQQTSDTPLGQAGKFEGVPTKLSQIPSARGGNKGFFFGLEKSLHELAAMEYMISNQHKLPPKLDPDGRLDVAETLVVIRHLKNRWSGREVKRQYERKTVTGSLEVAREFATIRHLVGQDVPGEVPKHLRDHSLRVGAEDVSATGVGLKVTQQGGWVKIGMLLIARTDLATGWRLGVVRRTVAQRNNEMLVGVQFLSRTPESIRLTRKAVVSQWEKVSDQQAWDNIFAMYLAPDALNGNQHLLILEKPELEPGKSYFAPTTRSGDVLLRVVDVHEICADCVMYRCERTVVDANAKPASRPPEEGLTLL